MTVTRLDRAYDQSVHRVRTQLLRLAKSHWNGLDSWRDADFERLLKVLVPRLEAGQQEIANLTDAYIRRLAIDEFGKIRNGLPVAATTWELRGVPSETVYHRPFATTYAALASGKAVSAAVAEGRERLIDVVSSGAQLAKTHSARGAMSRSGFTKFQRTLTGRENCAMCVLASTQRYHKEDLLPMHPGCDCGVKPFESDMDVQIINADLLEETHSTINSKLGLDPDDRDARFLGIGKEQGISEYTELIVTREHGEMGPMLTWRTDKFTGSKEIK